MIGTVYTGSTLSFADKAIAVSTATIPTSGTTAFQIQNGSGANVIAANIATGQVSIDDNLSIMASPTGLAVSQTGSAVGDGLGIATYYYKVTAIDSAEGETSPSAEVSHQFTSGTTNYVTLTWNVVTGASGYKVYRGTSSGGESVYYSTLGSVSGSTVTFTDTGSPNTNGSTTPPTTSTAVISANTINSSLQVTIGGNGTPTGQLYVSGSISGIVGTNTTGMTAPMAVFVQGQYAYTVNNNWSGTGTLVIDDISNPANPTFISQTTNIDNANAIYVQGHYAYVGNWAGLTIFDVSNPANPTYVGSETNTYPISSVYVQGNYAYLTNWNIDELIIYNISNPSNPTYVSWINTVSAPTSVHIQGEYAYVLATGNPAYVEIYNISNPANPTYVSETSNAIHILSNTNSNPQELYVQGRYVYVVSPGNQEMIIYDISNPSNPSYVGETLYGSVAAATSVYVQGRYAYVTDEYYNDIAAYDVSNPANPTFVNSSASSSVPMPSPQAIYVQGRYAYVASYGDSLMVVDLGGAYVQQIQAGGTETGTLQVDGNSILSGDASITGGLTVGSNAQISGNFSVAGATNLGSVVTITGGPASSPTISSVTPTPSGGSTTYTYKVAAINGSGQTTAASVAVSITTGPATLSATTYNTISWAAIAGAYGYNVYRTVDGQSGQPANIGQIGITQGTSFTDIGYTANTSATAPSTNSITTAFQVQNAAGNNVMAVDTTNNQVVLGKASTLAGQILFNGSGAYAVTLNTGATAAAYTITLPTAAPTASQCLISGPSGSISQFVFGACGGSGTTHPKSVILPAEYAGATLYSSGGSNIGTMTAGYTATGTGGKPENYYQWTTTQSTNQAYSIVVQIPLPADANTSAPAVSINIDADTSSTTNGTILAKLYDTAGSVVTNWNSCTITPSSANTWTTMVGATSCIISSGTWNAGQDMTLVLTLQAPTSGTTDVGTIVMNYTTQY
jgi:hypothetical protein